MNNGKKFDIKHALLRNLLPTLITAVLLSVSSQLAAAPILGGQLYYTGGTVTVTTMPATSGYTSELQLYDSSFHRIGSSYIVLDEPAGITVDITALITGAGIGIGDELIFGNYVRETGNEFFMGPAGRNPDGIAHAVVNVISTSPIYTVDVGFEDLWGGGDRDYDDNVFRLAGGISVVPPSRVPEPASLALLGLGLAGLAASRRKQHPVS